MKIDLMDDKYTAIFEEETGKLYALRYGEEWRNLSGDKFVLALMQKIEESSEIAKECLEIIGGIWDKGGFVKAESNVLLLVNSLEEKLVEIRRGVNENG